MNLIRKYYNNPIALVVKVQDILKGGSVTNFYCQDEINFLQGNLNSVEPNPRLNYYKNNPSCGKPINKSYLCENIITITLDNKDNKTICASFNEIESIKKDDLIIIKANGLTTDSYGKNKYGYDQPPSVAGLLFNALFYKKIDLFKSAEFYKDEINKNKDSLFKRISTKKNLDENHEVYVIKDTSEYTVDVLRAIDPFEFDSVGNDIKSKFIGEEGGIIYVDKTKGRKIKDIKNNIYKPEYVYVDYSYINDSKGWVSLDSLTLKSEYDKLNN